MEGKENGMCCSGGACGGKCNCMHHKMFSILIVAFGTLFLFQAYGQIDSAAVAIVWPVIVILAGLSKLFKGMCKCC